MNPALRKEIRLLLPAWIVALIAGTVPVWMMGADIGVMEQMAFIFFAAGALLLSLASFGLEMSLGTFPSLLAQPRPRLDTWQMKIGVLAAALALVVVAACFSWWLRIQAGQARIFPFTGTYFTYDFWPVALRPFLLPALIAFAGGLWTTLLFRQIVTSFWFAFLVPVLLYRACWPWMWEEDDTSFFMFSLGVVGCVYAAVGYCLARWLFLHAQDKQAQEDGYTLAWLSLPAFPTRRRPVAALLVKELRWHQGTLLICAGLVVLHLAALVVPQYFPALARKYLNLRHFWMLWVPAPLVVGCASFAEERRAQTLQSALCLPIRPVLQFSIKLLVVFGLGIFLGAVTPWLLEQLRPGVQSGVPPFAELLIAATITTAIGCYASSLSGSLLQAIGAAIGVAIGILLMLIGVAALFHLESMMGDFKVLWWPVLIASGICLSYRNFKQSRITWRRWVGNGLILTAVVFSLVVFAYVFLTLA
jgi:hypothetical protein